MSDVSIKVSKSLELFQKIFTSTFMVDLGENAIIVMSYISSNEV